MRTNHVAKARKDQGTCSKCGQPIPKGATYKWLKGRYGPRRSYHASCVIPRSHTTGSAKLGQLWDAQDTLEDAIAGATCQSDLTGSLEECRGTAEEVRDEYQESLDNMPEGLQQGSTGEDIQNKIDEIESWVSELEDAVSEIDGMEWPEEPDEAGGIGKAGEVVTPANDEATNSDGQTVDEVLEDARGHASDACGSLGL